MQKIRRGPEVPSVFNKVVFTWVVNPTFFLDWTITQSPQAPLSCNCFVARSTKRSFFTEGFSDIVFLLEIFMEAATKCRYHGVCPKNFFIWSEIAPGLVFNKVLNFNWKFGQYQRIYIHLVCWSNFLEDFLIKFNVIPWVRPRSTIVALHPLTRHNCVLGKLCNQRIQLMKRSNIFHSKHFLIKILRTFSIALYLNENK